MHVSRLLLVVKELEFKSRTNLYKFDLLLALFSLLLVIVIFEGGQVLADCLEFAEIYIFLMEKGAKGFIESALLDDYFVVSEVDEFFIRIVAE